MQYWKFLNVFVMLVLINGYCSYSYADDVGKTDLTYDKLGELEYSWCAGRTYLKNSTETWMRRIISAMEDHWLKKRYLEEPLCNRVVRLEAKLHISANKAEPILDRINTIDLCGTIEAIEIHLFNRNYPKENPS